HPSTAFHVLVTVLAHEVPPVTSLPTWFTVASFPTRRSADLANVGVAGHSIVAAAPALPIVGAVRSTIVIVWLRVPDVLPQPSTAFHVLVTVLAHEVPRVASVPTWFTDAPLQASDAVGWVNVGVAGHSIVAAAPEFGRASCGG